MQSLSPEKYFKDALSAFSSRDYQEAAVLFRRALELDRERGRKRPEMRYLSYYGLCLARAGNSPRQALAACRKAVRRQPGDPVLYLNLGRVLEVNGKSGQAMQMFESGLKLAPSDRTLKRALRNLDRRSIPVISFLSRSNPLNRWLGKLRARQSMGLSTRSLHH
jgi:tetratricopeptide (TPR) repeat protein